MKRSPSLSKRYRRLRAVVLGVAVAGIAGLLLYQLGTLTGGMSSGELAVASTPLGWKSLYLHPFYLPLEAVRAAVFLVYPDHGALLTRLPSALFGGIAILSFAWVVRIWHGRLVSFLATLLFATSAWVLHSSRWASFDVMYLWAIPLLWLVQLALKKHSQRAVVWYGSLAIWGSLLYIPGMVWFVLVSFYAQREAIMKGWLHLSHAWQRMLYVMIGAVWFPLLIIHLTRQGALLAWFGLPAQLPTPAELGRQMLLVPYHLFGRGPHAPEFWLGRLPILDVFTLAACLLGIYFYARHLRAARTQLLATYAILGWILVAAGGAVSLSLLVPLLYLAAATGLASLLHQWFTVFPRNPLARSVGIGLLSLAVIASSVYNFRAYFVAWPHNSETRAIFQQHKTP